LIGISRPRLVDVDVDEDVDGVVGPTPCSVEPERPADPVVPTSRDPLIPVLPVDPTSRVPIPVLPVEP
jgi:hypothetical protein